MRRSDSLDATAPLHPRESTTPLDVPSKQVVSSWAADAMRSSASPPQQQHQQVVGPSHHGRPPRKKVRWRPNLVEVRHFEIYPSNRLGRKPKRIGGDHPHPTGAGAGTSGTGGGGGLGAAKLMRLVHQRGEEFLRFFLKGLREDVAGLSSVLRADSIATIRQKKLMGVDNVLLELRSFGPFSEATPIASSHQPVCPSPPSFLTSLVLACTSTPPSRVASSSPAPSSSSSSSSSSTISYHLHCLFYIQKDSDDRWYVKSLIQSVAPR